MQNSKEAAAEEPASPRESRSAAYLLASSVVVAAVSAPIADALFAGFVVAAARSVDWPHCWRSGRYRALLLALAVIGCWMLFRVSEPMGWGLQTYARQFHKFPITVLDYVPYLLVYAVLVARRRSEREVRFFFWALLASLPFHVILACGQWWAGWSSFRWLWEWSDIVIADVMVRVHPVGGLSAGLFNHIGLALYANLSLVIGAVLWIDFIRRHRRKPTAFRLRAHLGFAAITLASLFLLAASAARVSLVVAILIGLFLLHLAGVKRWIIFSALSLGALILMLAITEVGWASKTARQLLPSGVAARLQKLDAFKGGAVVWRYELYECCWTLVGERPWAGWGVSAMAPECAERLDRTVVHAHNYFLQLATELGLPTAVALLLILTAPLAAFYWRSIRPDARGDPILVTGVWVVTVVIVLLSNFDLLVLHSNRFNAIFWWSHCVIGAYFWAPIPARP